MGNVPSTEDGPKRDLRASHKLSKPRTGNPTAAGLLSPNGLSTTSARNSYRRTTSLPYGHSPLSPSTLPVTEEASETAAEQAQPERPKESRERSMRTLFRSKSSNATPKYRERRSTASGTTTPSGDHLPSRTNSMIYAPGTMDLYVHSHRVTSLSVAGSRTSLNYNMMSYEAKRLLGLVEASEFEDISMKSESHFQVSAATWKSSHPHNPSSGSSAPSAPIVRANSEVSLYTPMRRRSMMTPGVATRTSRSNSIVRPPHGRYSLPPTPARRDSFDDPEPLTMQSIPLPSFEAKWQPPVMTPNDSDYSKLGAFKLGSLRITNGSPVPSPAVERKDHDNAMSQDLFRPSRDGYFGQGPVERTQGLSDSGRNPVDKVSFNSLIQKAVGSTTNHGISVNIDGIGRKAADETTLSGPSGCSKPLPEIQVGPNPVGSGALSPELQTTSKHTAEQDELFDDELHDGHPEVLDVRVDPSAKALPPRPKLKSDSGVHRTDSGFVGSPTTEHSHTPLAKADSGYSSNVSLRSFTTKAKAPELVEQEDSPTIPPKDAPILSTAPNLPAKETPPPVPAKDQHPTREGSSSSRQHLSIKTPSLSQKTRNALAPITGRRSMDGDVSSPLPQPGSPHSPLTPISPLSIGSNSTRKPSKLQRLLTGGKSVLSVHVTHPSGSDALDVGVPPIPQEVEAKLRHHTGIFPLSSKRLALKPESSRHSLGTILSVGSFDALADEGLLPPSDGNVPASDDKALVTSLPAGDSSLGNGLASILNVRRPINRKPVPIRHYDDKVTTTVKIESETILTKLEVTATNLGLKRSSRKKDDKDGLDATFLAMSTEREAYYASADVLGVIAPGLPQNADSDIESWPKKTKTAPPVSMRTRNSSSLRVPAPLRPQSTPPGALRSSTLSRKSSRENVYSYPPAQQEIPSLGPSLSPRTSREKMFDNYGLQQGLTASHRQNSSTNMRRSFTAMTQTGHNYRTPNWNVLTDHASAPNSRRPSFDQSCQPPAFVDSGNANQYGPVIQRPNTAQTYRRTSAPPLRHRQSYDGYKQQRPVSYYHPQGPYPAVTGANGHQYVTDPWSGQPVLQNLDQSGPYVPYVPRGHYRDRSAGSQDQFGNPVPYRVLHSYNSPAYRNAPIWG